MKLTKEQYEVLKRNEQHLSTAYKGWWVRNLLPEEARALHEIDIALNGDKEPFSPSCGTCVLRICRRLGEPYFKGEFEVDAPKAEPKVEKTPKKAKTIRKAKVNA